MKKITFLSWALCAAVFLHCMIVPAAAVPVEVPQTVPVEETAPAPTQSSFLTNNSKLPFGQLSIQEGCRSIEGMQPLGGSERMLATAQAAMVFEEKTGTVIYSYNPDVKIAPGSLAKIVTAYVALQFTELDDQVKANSQNISRLPPGSKHKDMKHDEVFTVEDLLHCLLLESANDAAIVLAEHISGNMQGFLVLMNEWVKSIGCRDTEFGNVHGLSNATSYTTARDLVRITMEARKDPEFNKIFGTAKYTVPETNRSPERSLITTNYLIDQSIIPQFYDTHVTGGKEHAEGTFTSMVCTATYDKMDLICVVLGANRVFAENGWSVVSYGNFNEMNELLEYTSANYKVNSVLFDGQALSQFSVIDGECDVIGQPYISYDTVLPKTCQMDNLFMEWKVVGGGLTAPIKAGEMIATVAMKYRNAYIAEAEIYAMNNVASVSDSNVSIHSTAGKKENSMGGFMGFVGSVGVILVGVFGLYLVYNAYRRARRRIQRRRRRASRRRSY